jgi:signal transduction histidine kinase
MPRRRYGGIRPRWSRPSPSAPRPLSIAKELAEAANRAKSTFLANMSHELRTPLNGVLGMITLARRRMVDPKGLDQIDKATDAAKRLLAIINDILDLTKIEAERLNLEAADFKLGTVLDDMVDLVGESARRKGLELRSKPRRRRGTCRCAAIRCALARSC